MKKYYQIPDVDILCMQSKYIMMDPSKAELPPGEEMTNKNTFDEGEIATGNNTSLWDD